MLISIYTLKLVSLVIALTAVLSGYFDLKPLGLFHPQFSIPAVLIIYVNEVLTLFYFIQTGRGMKDDAAEAGIDPPVLAEARQNHTVASKRVVMNILAITIAGALGGLSWVASFGAGWHGIIAVAGVALYFRGTFDSMKRLWKNSEYMNVIAELYAEAVPEKAENSSSVR